MTNKIKITLLLLFGTFIPIFVFLVTLLLSFGVGHYIFMAILFPAQTDFKNGVPDNFMVVVEDKTSPNIHEAFTVRYWHQQDSDIPELAKKHPEMFRLSTRGAGRFFKVIEETAEHQIVELWHDNTYIMHLRYKVAGSIITPLYYKIYASMGASLYFLPIVPFLLWLSLFTSRRSVRWVNQAIESVDKDASPKNGHAA